MSSKAKQGESEVDALRDTNQLLNTIILNSPLPIVALTAEGDITVWNPAAERLFGWTEAEVIGKPLPFIPESKLDEHRAMRQRDLAGQGFTGLEVRRKRKDGTPVDLSVSTAPLRGPDGRVTGIMSLYVDITEQKRVREELRRSEQRYRFLAESIPQMVWTADPDGTIDYVNQKVVHYICREGDHQEASDWWAAVHPDDKEEAANRWAACLESGDVFTTALRLCLSSTGGYHWHLVRALPLLDEAGRVTRWFGTCTDIQEQKAVEDELRRANEDLNQFAYSASHDLQEPLRMIASYTQLLHRRYGDKLDSAADTYIGYTVEGVKRMQALLADLLAYTQAIHVETADGEIADAQQALDKVWSNLRETRAASGAEIRRAALPHVRMNEAHLVQVFQNLISNAMKYRGAEPPVIEIGAARRGTHWEFSVRDNGIGIAPRYATQVFGIFKRLHSSATLPGTGIGLAICQKIVERYGGRIWVESEGEGKGSTFFFTVAATDAGV